MCDCSVRGLHPHLPCRPHSFWPWAVTLIIRVLLEHHTHIMCRRGSMHGTSWGCWWGPSWTAPHAPFMSSRWPLPRSPTRLSAPKPRRAVAAVSRPLSACSTSTDHPKWTAQHQARRLPRPLHHAVFHRTGDESAAAAAAAVASPLATRIPYTYHCRMPLPVLVGRLALPLLPTATDRPASQPASQRAHPLPQGRTRLIRVRLSQGSPF